jgi:ribosomal-protein-alanine N-acetyltransferase
MITIKTKRLIIREEMFDDSLGIQKLLQEPEGRIFTGGVKNLTLNEIKGKIDERKKLFSTDFEKIQKNLKKCIFNVIKNDTSKFVGYCGFQFCTHMNKVELLYGFLKQFWKKGIGYEVADNLLNFGFSQTNMNEVFAVVNPKNIASEKIIQKIGMKFNKKIPWPEQGMVNQYGITKSEYINK